MRSLLSRLLRKGRWVVDRVRVARNRAPIVVLGNQKSGTSAIGHLLADCCGLTKTIDIPAVWDEAFRLQSGHTRLAAVARRAPAHFATELVKEPHLTFVFREVLALYPRGAFVFVVRDPRDNIRSILDRLGLPGSTRTIETTEGLPRGWAPVVCHGAEEERPIQVIRNLARRWCDSAVAPEQARLLTNHVHVVGYEEFTADKEGCIRLLAERLGLRPLSSIADTVDVQYQPRGSHRGVTWERFFDPEMLRLIEDVCGPEMDRLGYERTLSGGSRASGPRREPDH